MSGLPCLPWAGPDSARKGYNHDKLFTHTDGTAENAANYCRSPESTHLWCNAHNGDEWYDWCDVPLCSMYISLWHSNHNNINNLELGLTSAMIQSISLT
jgi:hypothetical protein